MSEEVFYMDLSSPKFEVLYEDNHYKHFVFISGRGTGKSWAIGDYIGYATHEHKVLVFCARTVQNSLAQSSWRIVKGSLERLGIIDDYELVESKSLMRCKTTGSEIIFGGIDSDPDKFKSTEGIDIFWYEEAHTVSKDALEMTIPTIRKPNSICIWSANPRFETDPFSREFLGDTKRDNAIVVRLYPEDNKYFPDDLKKEMEYCKATDPESYRHIWLGEYASSSSESLCSMDAVKMCVGLPVVDSHNQTFAGLDIGATGDPTAIYIRRGRQYLAHKEWFQSDHGILLNDVCDYMSKHKVDLCMPDATGFGYTFAQNLQRHYGKDKVIPINFASSATIDGFVNRRAEMALSVRNGVNEGMELPNDPQLIEELGTVRIWRTQSNKWQLEGKNEIRSRLGRSSNWLDAIMLSKAIPDRFVTNSVTNRNKNAILKINRWAN